MSAAQGHMPRAAALLCAKHLFVAARVRSMGNLLFWLGIGAAQKGAGSKALDRRNRALSFAVGTLLALLIAVGMFILLVSQQ